VRQRRGATHGIAADLALASDQDYSAANLLHAVLARGIDPTTLPKLSVPARRRSTAKT
jgi:hypothetical protein